MLSDCWYLIFYFFFIYLRLALHIVLFFCTACQVIIIILFSVHQFFSKILEIFELLTALDRSNVIKLAHFDRVSNVAKIRRLYHDPSYLFFFFRRKQCYRTAFNFLTAVHGRRQSPPVISTARQFRAGATENRMCERAEPAPECDIISRRRRRSSSSPRRDSRRGNVQARAMRVFAW